MNKELKTQKPFTVTGPTGRRYTYNTSTVSIENEAYLLLKESAIKNNLSMKHLLTMIVQAWSINRT